jgi:amidase
MGAETCGTVANGSAPFLCGLEKYSGRQRALRAAWGRYFYSADVFLMPVAFVPAFLHDHSEPRLARKISTPDGERNYSDMYAWQAMSILTGLPASVAPIGRTNAGLPIGLQIIGPMWEDATPMEFAELLSQSIGGFQPPVVRQ